MKQKLQDNNNKISKLKKSKNLLIKRLEKQKRINESKPKENNELKIEIKKLEKSRIELSGLPKLLKDNRASPDKNEEWLKLEGIKIPEDFNIDKYFKGEKNKYLDINLSDVNNLVDKIKQDIKKIDNITDIGNDKRINFNDIINFLNDIMNVKINNSNKEKEYNEKFKNIEENLENKTKDNNTIKLYIIYLNQLKKYYLLLKNHQAKV